MVWIPVTFKVGTLPEEEENSDKRSKLLNPLSRLLNLVRLYPLNDFGFVWETCMRQNLVVIRLRPYSVSSPLNSLSGRAESVRITCREAILRR